jgi:hypothetical protein
MEHRSKAEIFVTEFIDYVNRYDILDEFNKKTQKMERSSGVESLIMKAKEVFPERTLGPSTVPEEEVTKIISEASHVLDRRDHFALKIQANRGAQGLLEDVLAGKNMEIAQEFIKALKGEKEFE